MPWLGDSFNLLPVLMFGVHLLIARAGSDHGLTRSMFGTPILFAILFYPFPAVALIFWVTGNSIQVLETIIIGRRFSTEDTTS